MCNKVIIMNLNSDECKSLLHHTLQCNDCMCPLEGGMTTGQRTPSVQNMRLIDTFTLIETLEKTVSLVGPKSLIDVQLS